MISKRIAITTSALALVVAPLIAVAGGSFQTLPILGGSSYCASQVTLSGGQGCGQTVPAGPSSFAGTEVMPADISTPGSTGVGSQPQTVAIPILSLGQGAIVDQTTVASATIPNGVAFFYVDGASAGAFTITMPPSPTDGAIVTVVCQAATVGVMTVAANTGQTLKNNPNAACVAGTPYQWRYTAASATWYRS